ncbi:hypothetical protein BC834DRAFT_858146 [Gloeopeniophorella convolvens]|nr:hypothetical protein BC834DRAFT_858146 [Gloeopeniophorella convolvens]
MRAAGKSTQGRLITTYSHKKSKAQVFHASSSPIKTVDREDISVAEMSRRMKKRARQSISDLHLSREQGLADSQRLSKRPRNTPDAPPARLLESNGVFPPSMYTDSLISLNDVTHSTQYQTPFNLSPASSPSAADPMSPVPVSRRRLSRTTSRTLKENSTVNKALASPFHSRSTSKAGSRRGSKANSPRKNTTKPKSYLKARTRSEANLRVDENYPGNTLLPVSGSLPTLDSAISRRLDTYSNTQSSDDSTAYMLQHLSEQDWFRPAKALSHSPFSEDYVPPETPFPEWECSADSLLDGIPLQTSTPVIFKKPIAKLVYDEGTPSAPNTPDRNVGDADVDMTDLGKPGGLAGPSYNEHGKRHFSKDSIFSSSFNASATMTSGSSATMASGFPSGGIKAGFTSQRDVFPKPAGVNLDDSGPVVTDLSGMLDSLDIDGVTSSYSGLTSLGGVNRSRSLDSGTEVVSFHSNLDAHQAAGRKRDRASTIRASDYTKMPAIAPPRHDKTLAEVVPLTTRTRSGTIRPARPPIFSSSGTCSGAPMASYGEPRDSVFGGPLALAGVDITPLDTSFSQQGIPEVVAPAAREKVKAAEDMVIGAPSNGSDDELLLDNKGWNWDGRWD